MIRLPVYLGKDLTQRLRLHPSSLRIVDNLAPLSTAVMELPQDEGDVLVGEYVRLYTALGSAGVYRVQQREQEYGSTASLSLEHGLCSLADGVIHGTEDRTGTAQELLTWMLSAQPKEMWRVGTVEVPGSETLTVSNDNANILEGLTGLMEQLPGYRIACDQTRLPWKVSILRLDEGTGCVCRMRRNISSLTVEDDRSDLCTRLYVQGLEDPIDADTIGEYGVVERYMTMDDGLTDEDRRARAQAYLDEYGTPRVSMTIDAVDLSRETGQDFDALTPGKMCLVALPGYGKTMRQRIIRREWKDVYAEPDAVKITLATESRSAATTLAGLIVETTVTRKKYVTDMSRQKELIIAADERIGIMSTRVDVLAQDVEVNAEKIALKASTETVDDMDRRLSAAEIGIDGVEASVKLKADKKLVEDQGTRLTSAEANIQGALGEIELKASKTEVNNLGETVSSEVARIDLTYDSILQQIQQAGETMTQISATLDGIDAWSKDTEGNIADLAVSAKEISGKVTSVEGDVGQLMLSSEEFRATLQSGDAVLSELKVLQEEISQAVYGANGDIGALTVRSDAIAAQVGKTDAQVTQLLVDVDGIRATVQNGDAVLSELKVKQDEISQTVNGANGDIGALSVKADAITAKVESASKGVSQLTVDMDGIRGDVSGLDGRVGKLELTDENFSATITGIDDRVGKLELKDNEFAVAIGTDGLGGRLDIMEGILNLQAQSGGNTVSLKLNAMDNSITAKADKTYVDDLFAKTITTDSFKSFIASIDYINMSGGLSANSIQAQFGILANATIGNRSCAPRTLTIGSKSCVFFGPEDATFDLADTEEFQAAVSAVSLTKGDPSHAYVSDTHGYSVSIPYTLSNGKSGTLSHVLVADDAYNDGKNSVTVYSNKITCVNTGPNQFYVTVELTNGIVRNKTFTINVGQK